MSVQRCQFFTWNFRSIPQSESSTGPRDSQPNKHRKVVGGQGIAPPLKTMSQLGWWNSNPRFMGKCQIDGNQTTQPGKWCGSSWIFHWNRKEQGTSMLHQYRAWDWFLCPVMVHITQLSWGYFISNRYLVWWWKQNPPKGTSIPTPDQSYHMNPHDVDLCWR